MHSVITYIVKLYLKEYSHVEEQIDEFVLKERSGS